MHSYYFIYFIILGNNSDNFVLDKYIVRSSFYIKNTYNKFVVHSIFFKSVLSIVEGKTLKETTIFTNATDTTRFVSTKSTFKMAGYFPTFAILSWLIQTACFQLDGKEDDQKGGRSTVKILMAVQALY